MTYAYWACKIQAIAIEHGIQQSNFKEVCKYLPDELINEFLENKLTGGIVTTHNAIVRALLEEELIERTLLGELTETSNSNSQRP